MLKSSFLMVVGSWMLIQGCARTGNVDKRAVAIVNNQRISLTSYIDRYRDFLGGTGVNDNLQVRHTFLQTLIDERLLLEWADSTGIIDCPSDQQNMKEIDEQILLNKLYEEQIEARIEVSDLELRQLYRWSKTRIHARHLFAPDVSSAQELYRRLNGGERWEVLARETFREPVLASNGGDLGFFEVGDMDPAFEAVAFQLNDGEISAPVKTRQGFSIVQVIEREYDPFLIEDQFQLQQSWLKQTALSLKKLPAVRAYTDSIRARLNIQFFEDAIEHVWEQIDKIQGGSDEISVDAAELRSVRSDIPDGTWTISETFKRLRNLSYRQKQHIDSEENLKSVISGLIIREQLLKKAKELRLDSTDEFRRESVRARDSYIVSEIINAIYKNARPTREELESYYRDHANDLSTAPLFEVAEIVVADSGLAADLYRRVLVGERFQDLAARFSVRKSSASKGGYLGWGTPQQFGMLGPVLSKSKEGDIIGPVAIGQMFVILQVVKLEPPRRLSFDQSIPEMEKALEFQTRRRAFIAFRDRLKEHASISVDSALVRELTLDQKKL